MRELNEQDKLPPEARRAMTRLKVAAQQRIIVGVMVGAALLWLVQAVSAYRGAPAAAVLSVAAATCLLVLLALGAWRMVKLLHRTEFVVETLRQRESQYRALADNLPGPLVRFDREGRHLYANPVVEEATGVPAEAFIGKTNAELGMPPAIVEQWSAQLSTALRTGRPSQLEFNYPGPLGQRDWESHIVPEPGPDGVPATVLVFSRDVTEAHRVEKALRRSELRFRLAASFGQVWDWDIETDEISFPAAFWTGLGRELPEPPYRLGMLEALMHPDDRPSLRRAIGEHLARRTPYSLEFRALAADGSEHWFQTQGQAVWNDQGRATYMAGTTFDITERKRGEQEMRIKDAAFASSLNGIALADLAGAITYVNPAFCKLWGVTQAEALGRSVLDFWRDVEEPMAAMNAVVHTGQWAGEMIGQHSDGHEFVVDASALLVRNAASQAICMMGTFIDITRRKQAESALLQMNAELERRVRDRTAELAVSEERYRTIFELVPVAIAEEDWSQVQQRMRELRSQGVSDGPAYLAANPGFVHECMRGVRLLRMNRRMLAMHEARSQSEDFPTLEAVYGAPEHLPGFVEELEAVWRGDRLYRSKKTVATVRGRLLSLMVSMALPAPEGGDGRAFVTIVDITEVDRLNEELDASLERLKRVNRELETFSYSVSHDLKAPLRGIDGYSRLLLRDHEASLDEEARGFLSNIRLAAQHMAKLIDDLLAYSRLERQSVEISRLDLRALVDNVVAMFAEEIARRGLALRVDIAPGQTAWADAQALSAALQNLVDNALKFTRTAEHPMVTIAARDAGQGVSLSVQDNGLGFDMKFHDRIFDIFQRLHRAEDYPGTGVGLAIVRKAMERMGGRAWAVSAPGAGATFHLQLPTPP